MHPVASSGGPSRPAPPTRGAFAGGVVAVLDDSIPLRRQPSRTSIRSEAHRHFVEGWQKYLASSAEIKLISLLVATLLNSMLSQSPLSLLEYVGRRAYVVFCSRLFSREVLSLKEKHTGGDNNDYRGNYRPFQ